MNIINKEFNQLTVTELYEIIKLRVDVFVVEQNCVYDDLDRVDYNADHIFLKNKNEIIAYLRIYKNQNNYSIGRVAVNVKYRKNNYGKLIMNYAINLLNNTDADEVKIEAQEYLLKFYTDLGFIKTSESFLLDGIPHIDMSKKLKQ